MKKIRVLIVDDSLIMRQVLRKSFTSDTEIEVVGSAPDPYIARDMIVALRPDVITLDIEMPRMDGMTFLRKLMKSFPLPVVVVSAHTAKGCALTFEAFDEGAMDVVNKPTLDTEEALNDFTITLCDKIKAAARASVKNAIHHITATSIMSRPSTRIRKSDNKVISASSIIAIGASTGGTDAIKTVLIGLPKNSPPVVVVQHMPEGFTSAFARRLNSICELEVLEAENMMECKKGRVIIANGAKHLAIKKRSSGYYVQTKEGPLVCRHRPSVEVLFNSVAQVAGKHAIGIMLTGMGVDGAQGLKNMRANGAKTIAQDEESCVVYGMPGEAVKINAVDSVVSLDKIAQKVFSYL